jgi:hypothetical protein
MPDVEDQQVAAGNSIKDAVWITKNRHPSMACLIERPISGKEARASMLDLIAARTFRVPVGLRSIK